MTTDPVAALLAEVPQREHTPRRYLGPQPAGWRPGRGPYRASHWRRYGPEWPAETLYTEEYYQAVESPAARRREAYRRRRDKRQEGRT